MLEDRKTALENAAYGKVPECETEIPAFLTAERTFELLKEVAKRSVNAIKPTIKALKAGGNEIKKNDERVIEAISKLRLDDLRKEIFKEAGMDKFAISSTQLFQAALLKYAKENPNGFNEKLMVFEKKHEALMVSLMEGNLADLEKLLKNLDD
jgi:hypothetical protein